MFSSIQLIRFKGFFLQNLIQVSEADYRALNRFIWPRKTNHIQPAKRSIFQGLRAPSVDGVLAKSLLSKGQVEPFDFTPMPVARGARTFAQYFKTPYTKDKA